MISKPRSSALVWSRSFWRIAGNGIFVRLPLAALNAKFMAVTLAIISLFTALVQTAALHHIIRSSMATVLSVPLVIQIVLSIYQLVNETRKAKKPDESLFKNYLSYTYSQLIRYSKILDPKDIFEIATHGISGYLEHSVNCPSDVLLFSVAEDRKPILLSSCLKNAELDLEPFGDSKIVLHGNDEIWKCLPQAKLIGANPMTLFVLEDLAHEQILGIMSRHEGHPYEGSAAVVGYCPLESQTGFLVVALSPYLGQFNASNRHPILENVLLLVKSLSQLDLDSGASKAKSARRSGRKRKRNPD